MIDLFCIIKLDIFCEIQRKDIYTKQSTVAVVKLQIKFAPL